MKTIFRQFFTAVALLTLTAGFSFALEPVLPSAKDATKAAVATEKTKVGAKLDATKSAVKTEAAKPAAKVDAAKDAAKATKAKAGAKVDTAKAAVISEQLDINTATDAQLKAVPGIGDAYAAKIIAGRPYAKKDQLKTRNILPGPAYDQIKDRIVAKQSAKSAPKKK
ncbi:MAG: helix-hairpin-helix domain-containing protein [Trichlorobacter sp.]|jgi:DNA uptake protein ComE-like DNA-binding protein